MSPSGASRLLPVVPPRPPRRDGGVRPPASFASLRRLRPVPGSPDLPPWVGAASPWPALTNPFPRPLGSDTIPIACRPPRFKAGQGGSDQPVLPGGPTATVLGLFHGGTRRIRTYSFGKREHETTRVHRVVP